MLNATKVRKDFPILKTQANGKPLVYLDSAATSQKPVSVINAVTKFSEEYNANIHRGIYLISERATAEYEAAREKTAKFINARDAREIVFTKNTTESINLVAYSWGLENLNAGDAVLVTEMEHHSNFVPWQQIAQLKKARFLVAPVTRSGELDETEFERLLRDYKPKLVAFTHASNVLGTINDAKKLTKKAHAVGAIVVLDAAQTVPHMPLDVRDLDVDFACFSGHKMLAPTGIGVLYGKLALLEKTRPFITGGGTIRQVNLKSITFGDVPAKFEGGTPPIAQAIGLGAAIDYLEKLGMKQVREHEKRLTRYALEKMSKLKNVEVYGPCDAEKRAGVISLNVKGVHAHDVAAVLDSDGICVRARHHCAQPLVTKLGFTATARASFYLYNTEKEIDYFVKTLEKVGKVFNKKSK